MSQNLKSIPNSSRELFLEALELGPLERTAFLRNACGKDKALRLEVEALFKDSEELGEFLEAPAVEGTRDFDSTVVRDDSVILGNREGDRIGPYKLLQKIGEGGCGRVYMAEQEKPIRRRVALKIIKLGMDTRSVIARFESERQALAMMEHSNIARVLDAGATETGRPYFVMELVRGVPITNYCDQQNLSTGERLELFIQVGNAIQHAHQKGIIHRDIKPSNILVTLHDGVPVPKIIDFGIAKATEHRLTDKTLFTQYEAFIGTPAYMSPEQAEMSGLDIDTRSDIYALGVLLYELLVGQTPFDAEALRQAGLDECRRTIRETDPARPSTRLATMVDARKTDIARRRRTEVPDLVSVLRGDLDWIVMKCLEKDRQRRYATVNDVVLDIRRHLNGEAVLARPQSNIYKIGKTIRRHRGAFVAAACFLSLLVASVIVSFKLMLRAREAETIVSASQEHQSRLREKAEEGWATALANERTAMLNNYVAEMNLTHLALQDGNFGRAIQLIRKHIPSADKEDFRGFEWRYLAGLCQGDTHVAFPRHNDAVEAVAISPDGDVMAAATPRDVRFWDVRNRALITNLSEGARSVAFLPDGRTFVTSSRGSVKIWNGTTYSEMLELPDQSGPVALSVDGSRMATDNGRSTFIWDTSTWEKTGEIQDTSSPSAFSPDGRFLVTISRDGLKLWNAETGTLVREFADSSGLFSYKLDPSTLVVFSPDGRFLLAPKNRKSERGVFVVGIWDVESGELLGSMPEVTQQIQHTGEISSIAFSADGNTIATGSWDHSIRLWDFVNRKHLTTLRGQSNEIWAVAFSPDGKNIAGGGKDGTLNLWPAREPEPDDTIPGPWTPLGISNDGNHLAAVDREKNVGFFHLGSLEQTRTLSLKSEDEKTRSSRWGSSGRLAVSADLNTLVQGLDNGNVKIWTTGTRETRLLAVATEKISSVELSPDGRYLVTRCHRQPLKLWDIRNPDSQENLATLEGENAVFSADGTTLVTMRERGSMVDVWDLAILKKRNTLHITPRPGFGTALSPDGGILATKASFDDFNNAIRLWDTATGDLLGECSGHKQGVWSVAFSPDGKTLVSSSDDSTLKFWNVSTQQEMLSVRRIGTTLTRLTFSPDGRWLVGAGSPFSSKGELRLMRAPGFRELDQWLSPSGKAEIQSTTNDNN